MTVYIPIYESAILHETSVIGVFSDIYGMKYYLARNGFTCDAHGWYETRSGAPVEVLEYVVDALVD